jgi:transposase
MEVEWFVGIDWATKEHVVCLLDSAGKTVGERAFPHTGDGIGAIAQWLFDKTGVTTPASFHVAIEVNRGAVVETLLEQGLNVYAINPKQLDRFRDRFTMAGAKDDRLDARVLADSLRTDRPRFRSLRVDDPLIIELRAWSRIAEELQDERVRLVHRFREQLLRYYPQLLDIANDLGRDWFLDLWEIVPTPAKAKRVRLATIADHLLERKVRSVKAKDVLVTLRETPLTVAPGATEAAVAHIRTIAPRLRLINKLIKEAEKNLDALISKLQPELKAEQRDATILLSLPGIGRMVVATLLAEASQPLGAREYQALRGLCGVAPVTRASGKRSGPRAVVVMRQACSVRLRNAVYYWSMSAIRYDEKSKAAYAALRERGKTHARALRSIADRLLKVACAMLRNGTLYDETKRCVPAAAA